MCYLELGYENKNTIEESEKEPCIYFSPWFADAEGITVATVRIQSHGIALVARVSHALINNGFVLWVIVSVRSKCCWKRICTFIMSKG